MVKRFKDTAGTYPHKHMRINTCSSVNKNQPDIHTHTHTYSPPTYTQTHIERPAQTSRTQRLEQDKHVAGPRQNSFFHTWKCLQTPAKQTKPSQAGGWAGRKAAYRKIKAKRHTNKFFDPVQSNLRTSVYKNKEKSEKGSSLKTKRTELRLGSREILRK